MKKLLYVGNQHRMRRRATLPFLFAAGALDAGHQAAVLLLDEAVYLASTDIVGSFKVSGLPSIAELIERLRSQNAAIYFSAPCCDGHGIDQGTVTAGGGQWATPGMIAQLMAECDAVLTI